MKLVTLCRPDLLISSCQSAEKGFLGASGCVCIAGGCVLAPDYFCMMSEIEIDMTKQYRFRGSFNVL